MPPARCQDLRQPPEGDLQDFEDFVALRSQALSRTAHLLRGGDKGAAEDIVQDVLMSSCGRWRRIRT
ncbi:hypothetical protein [Lentzea sp. E54]|uniref:hypothetical protein n=1 Tax=Lentzea xerophila TaxID=3435883 RepID=UPI003DA26BDC